MYNLIVGFIDGVDDIINLIWRARVVIADLSSKNPNVFYETGIAHTLGREVIQIAQSTEDIPFDLRAIRSQIYLNNGEGLERLKEQVVERLTAFDAAAKFSGLGAQRVVAEGAHLCFARVDVGN